MGESTRGPTLTVVLVVLLVLVGSLAYREYVVGAGGSPRTDSSSPEWLHVGAEAERATADVRDPMTGQPLPRDGYSHPLLSDPVDVKHTGDFEFVAGPVPDGATLRTVGFSLPPNSTEMLSIGRDGDPRFVDRTGRRYVAMTLHVSEVRRPYYGLRMWFLWGLG